MKERPILLSGADVRALLDRRKTQIRRAAALHEPADVAGNWFHAPSLDGSRHWLMRTENAAGQKIGGKDPMGIDLGPCPYGEPGDRLWVRETWRRSRTTDRYHYLADIHDDRGLLEATRGQWKPSIHMRREVSRITLEVTSVRVELVQSISEYDAQAEGATPFPYNPEGDCWEAGLQDHKYRTAFNYLWGTINGFNEGDAKRPGCSWDANPWVWAVGFKVVL